MKVLLKGEKEVGMAYDRYTQFNRDQRMRALDDAHQRYLSDYNTDVDAAHKKGEVKGEMSSILRVLKARFTVVPPEIQEKIAAIDDPGTLGGLVTVAAVCKSIRDFAKSL